MKLYSHAYRVEGWGIIPIDMLRYDQSFPATEQDSGTIINSMEDDFERLQTVSLVSLNSNPTWLPNGARWESFGWRVIA